MATPANRVPVRIARGTKANLDAAMAAGDLKEGEICYANDENATYVVESGILVAAGRGGASLTPAPEDPADSGAIGEIRFDDDHVYIATATDTWKRAEITTWSSAANPLTPATGDTINYKRRS